MKPLDYHPNISDFYSGLESGKSNYKPMRSKGRTQRERAKQSARAKRVYDRSKADADAASRVRK